MPEDLGVQRVVLRGSEGEAMQSLLRDPGSKHTPDLTAVHSCRFGCRVWGDRGIVGIVSRELGQPSKARAGGKRLTASQTR